MQARTLDLKSMSKRLAASVPVHAPVPGSGMPTNSSSAHGRPRPAVAFSFAPPLWPFSRQKVKNLPMTGLSAPHSSTLRARKKMNGTGSMLPMMEMMYTCHSGRPMATPTGIAPRSSIRGTIEIKNTLRYFVSI